MNAFRVLEIMESKEASDAFKEYFDNLNMSEKTKAKISIWDDEHPLYHNGFHPAFALHMINYNESLKSVQP